MKKKRKNCFSYVTFALTYNSVITHVWLFSHVNINNI